MLSYHDVMAVSAGTTRHMITLTASEQEPLSAERLAELAADGYSLAGGWSLREDQYGRRAVYLQFVRER